MGRLPIHGKPCNADPYTGAVNGIPVDRGMIFISLEREVFETQMHRGIDAVYRDSL
jgi:hypothetical protein